MFPLEFLPNDEMVCSDIFHPPLNHLALHIKTVVQLQSAIINLSLNREENLLLKSSNEFCKRELKSSL